MSEQEQKQTEDFNEVLEKVEVESSKEVNSDENLQEFKSSHGVDAEVPDAKATKTDEKPDAKGDKMTKVGMITAMMTKLNGMKKDEVENIVAMMKPENMEKMAQMKKDEMEKDEMTSDKPVEKLAAQVNKEDLDLSQDIDACIERCEKDQVPACVSVVEINKPLQWTFSLDKRNKLRSVLKGSEIPIRRQDVSQYYTVNGAVYAARIEWLNSFVYFADKEFVFHTFQKIFFKTIFWIFNQSLIQIKSLWNNN